VVRFCGISRDELGQLVNRQGCVYVLKTARRKRLCRKLTLRTLRCGPLLCLHRGMRADGAKLGALFQACRPHRARMDPDTGARDGMVAARVAEAFDAGCNRSTGGVPHSRRPEPSTTD